MDPTRLETGWSLRAEMGLCHIANFSQPYPVKANPLNWLKSWKIRMMEILKFPDQVRARVLVVDDHPSTASTLARAISQLGQGIEAIPAVSGEQALELAQDKPVDILITDMMMPGINGLELIERLQSQPEGHPTYIIVITAFDIAGRKIVAQKLNVDEVIIKPVRPERICQLVAKAISNLQELMSTKLLDSKPSLKPGWL